ncbi:hypothetical protein ALC56_06609 [Trachymyrmex septentrionalis]|uniref:Uncharacterized protein n=1 Tax=Trachymyrmex septentrionalis TaxID=34720 RepID=A0A195FFM6_9HYME|nr:hypothetical protein ALC56_06609 [Trachymyrmex septentrionalis]
MFDETVNCIGDIFLHKYALLHVSYNIRTTVNKVTKSKSKPTRSPDLNPLDYFLGGHLKSLVYTIPIDNKNDLRNRIVASCEAIRNTLGTFERVRQSLKRRLDGCIITQGGYFQQSI